MLPDGPFQAAGAWSHPWGRDIFAELSDVAPTPGPAERIGRYALHGVLAQGGMARVHVGRLVSDGGFSRTVAIKRLHPHFAADPDFVAGLLDEARLVSRIRHPSVVSTLDVVSEAGELIVVMEYVPGESLAALLATVRKAGARVPVPIAVAIVAAALHGLHAAHEATAEDGSSLGIVHRDVSPQNLLVGSDGLARVLDFGVAQARGRLSTTGPGQVKGKVAYMPPEQLLGRKVDRRADIYATGLVLWEALTSRRAFDAGDEGTLIGQVLHGTLEAPGQIASGIPTALDEIVLRAVARDPAQRFATALDFAVALEERIGVAMPRHVAAWVEATAGPALEARATLVSAIEQGTGVRLRAGGVVTMAGPDEETAVGSHGVAQPSPGQAAGGGSQVSSLSVSSAKRDVVGAPSRARLGLAGSAIAVAVALGLGWWWRGSPQVSDVPPPPAVAPAAASTAALPLEPPDAPPPASAAPAPSAAPATVKQPPAPARTPPATGKTAAAASAVPAPALPPLIRGDCDPPFVIGADGVRRLKKGCR